MTTIIEKMVEVVRNSKLVGNGSCSVVAECYSDEDLIVVFQNTARFAGHRHDAELRNAIGWAYAQQEIYLEKNSVAWADADTQNPEQSTKAFQRAASAEWKCMFG